MANSPTARKRVLQAERHRERNRSSRARMRTAVKRLRAAIQAGDSAKARDLLSGTLGLVDRTASQGGIHRNAADRTKSRLARAVQALD